MRKTKAVFCILLLLSTLLPIFSSCGECEHLWDDGYVAQEPTDKEVGYKVYTCMECGSARNEEIPKLSHVDHVYTKWSYDDTHHWYACDFKDCKAATGKHEHTWQDKVGGGYVCVICRHTK